MQSLFRKAAIQAHRQRLIGDVVLSQPKTFAITTAFLLLMSISLLVFVILAGYARKETVTGYLVPERGLVQVRPPMSGIVEQLVATEGQMVQAGAALVSISRVHINSAGQEINRGLLTQISNQLQTIVDQRSLEVRRVQQEGHRLREEIAGLEEQDAAVGRQLSLQRKLIVTLQAHLSAIASISKNGFISDVEFAAREEKLVREQLNLENLMRERAVLRSRSAQSVIAMEKLLLDSTTRLSLLASTSSELVQEKLRIESRATVTVTAPVSGTVSAVQVVTGAFADQSETLLTLLPDNSKLEAHLYVPTRAIGFIEVGQDVRLLFEAFDYRRFGTYGGKVSEVSRIAVSSTGNSSPIPLTEPSFRVTVALAGQSIDAYGQEYSLQAGMQLHADIILESRSIFGWITAPLFSLRGRT